jgi:hypothetical protein
MSELATFPHTDFFRVYDRAGRQVFVCCHEDEARFFIESHREEAPFRLVSEIRFSTPRSSFIIDAAKIQRRLYKSSRLDESAERIAARIARFRVSPTTATEEEGAL